MTHNHFNQPAPRRANQAGIAHLAIILVVVVLAIVAFAGYAVFMQSGRTDKASTTSIHSQTAAEEAAADGTSVPATTVAQNDAAAAKPDKKFAIVVEDHKLKSGPSTINVNEGDAVRVELTAVGEEANVKLDGYDINTEADPSDDTPGGFTFIANKKGSFKFYALSEANADGTRPATTYPLGTIVIK
jgi:plastocyanin